MHNDCILEHNDFILSHCDFILTQTPLTMNATRRPRILSLKAGRISQVDGEQPGNGAKLAKSTPRGQISESGRGVGSDDLAYHSQRAPGPP